MACVSANSVYHAHSPSLILPPNVTVTAMPREAVILIRYCVGASCIHVQSHRQQTAMTSVCGGGQLQRRLARSSSTAGFGTTVTLHLTAHSRGSTPTRPRRCATPRVPAQDEASRRQPEKCCLPLAVGEAVPWVEVEIRSGCCVVCGEHV